MKKLKLLLLILSIFLFVSCNNDSSINFDSNIDSEVNQEENISSNEEKDIVNRNISEENTTPLFPSDRAYNNEATMDIKINDEIVKGNFVIHKYKNKYGLYIPNFMEVRDFEDGNEFYLNDSEFITFVEDSIINDGDFYKSKIRAEKYIEDSFGPTNEVIKIDELKKYSEYLGSKFNNIRGKEEDFFLFKYNDKNLILVLTYYEENKDIVLPIFLEIIKTVKYIPTE